MPTPQYITLTDPTEPARPRHLAYYEWGDPANGNVAVCMHGLSRNGRDFDYLARALAGQYRVICPDVAGRGKSDWLADKASYAYPLYVADAHALLTQLNLSNVAWIGTSMGGIIGMMLAATPETRITRLALNDVGSVVSAAGLTRIMSYVGTSGGIFTNAEEAMTYLRTILKPFGIRTEEHWQFMLEASSCVLPDGRYALAYDPGITKPLRDSMVNGHVIADVDLSLFWNAIQCPVLILRGAESDILTRATADAMCQRTQPTKLVEFPNTGHAPALLEDDQIRAVTDWLA